MKSEPVRYSRLIMQLMTPTPMNALRQARNASPSSERRTPGAAAINLDLFTRGAAPDSKKWVRTTDITDFCRQRLLKSHYPKPAAKHSKVENRSKPAGDRCRRCCLGT